jgi:hypothetical protein
MGAACIESQRGFGLLRPSRGPIVANMAVTARTFPERPFHFGGNHPFSTLAINSSVVTKASLD